MSSPLFETQRFENPSSSRDSNLLDSEPFDRHVRLLVVGSEGSGKATLISSLSLQVENGEGWTSLCLDEQRISIQVSKADKWYPEFIKHYDAVAVVFATDDNSSFEYATDLLQEIRSACRIPIVVVENKMDKLSGTAIPKDVVETAMKLHKVRLYRVSAIQEFNVMHPMAYLLEKLTRDKDENSNERKESPVVQNIRLPSREGWGEKRKEKEQKNKNCSIM